MSLAKKIAFSIVLPPLAVLIMLVMVMAAIAFSLILQNGYVLISSIIPVPVLTILGVWLAFSLIVFVAILREDG